MKKKRLKNVINNARAPTHINARVRTHARAHSHTLLSQAARLLRCFLQDVKQQAIAMSSLYGFTTRLKKLQR